jgi:hypothetical protein
LAVPLLADLAAIGVLGWLTKGPIKLELYAPIQSC